MLSYKKLFELVINNNYDELSVAIQNKQVDFKAQNRRNCYIISSAIEYRSIECFELLVDSIPENKVNSFNIYESGLVKALEYYGNAPNQKNKYFIEKLLSKNMKIDKHYTDKLTSNIVIFNEFSQYVLNNNPEQYLTNTYMNTQVYEIIFNYCVDNDLLNNTVIKEIIIKAFDHGKEEIIILIKNSKYVNDIWKYYPNAIDQIINRKMSSSLLKFFVNLYNYQKPSNITIDKIVGNLIRKEISFDKTYHIGYSSFSSPSDRKKLMTFIEQIDILLTLETNDFYSVDINKKICEMITDSWSKKSWTNQMLTYKFHSESLMEFYITILFKFIEKSAKFELNLSNVETSYYDLIKKEKPALLMSGLKTVVNELIKLNKKIPSELDFIKDDNTILPLKLLTPNLKRVSNKKKDITI